MPAVKVTNIVMVVVKVTNVVLVIVEKNVENAVETSAVVVLNRKSVTPYSSTVVVET